MGQLGNLIDFQAIRRAKLASVASAAPHVGYSDLARLIPGISGSAPSAPTAPHVVRIVAAHLLPRFCHRFDATMLAPAILDLALVSVVFFLQAHALGSKSLPSPILFIYAFSFFTFAIHEDLYLPHTSKMSETAAVIRAVAWATLFAGLFLRWWTENGSGIILAAVSLFTWAALVGARQLWQCLRPSEAPPRNVLIVGSGTRAAQVAKAIQRVQNSSRLIKGFLLENHLRNSYGPAMLSRVAREQFVDELIIASSDPLVVDVAIDEACKNKLEVKIAPEVCIPLHTVDCENLGGFPLFKVRDYKSPEYRLALKRSLDFVLALVSLIALLPLLFLIAVCIKCDSAGPIFFCADRCGRKGRRFVCYKFRTMVPDADLLKGRLRQKNERNGAFFKIARDPRITCLGRFLRRYSLDELPQLWNVLLGDMSLVGPRPHPVDDVSRYEIRHLQRLDVVPGMTGLWQVTARRDPSFERNVALDIEYIKNWNLWLDVRILCKTVSAVLAGSGV